MSALMGLFTQLANAHDEAVARGDSYSAFVITEADRRELVLMPFNWHWGLEMRNDTFMGRVVYVAERGVPVSACRGSILSRAASDHYAAALAKTSVDAAPAQS